MSKLENARIVSFSNKEVEVELAVKITNPNSVGFSIYRSDVQLAVEGIDLGAIELADRIRVKRKSNKLHTFKVKADLSHISLLDLPKAMSIAQKRSVTVLLKGNLKAGNLIYRKKFPVDIKERVDLNR